MVNATGVWVDALRDMDRDANAPARPPMVAPSQGVHLVVDRAFMPGSHALMVPRTADGRVLFVVPWLGKTILGTTDTPRHDLDREPTPFKAEVDFILGEAGRYLTKQPTRADVRSVWVGLRPLVKPGDDDGDNTKALSREHTVVVARSGLVTVTGGKWTTYRAMAEDVLDQCMSRGLLATPPGRRHRAAAAAWRRARAAVVRGAWRAPVWQRGGAAAQPARCRHTGCGATANRARGPERSDGALCAALRNGAGHRRRAGAAFAATVPGCGARRQLVEPVAALIEDELGRAVERQASAMIQGAGAPLPDAALSVALLASARPIRRPRVFSYNFSALQNTKENRCHARTESPAGCMGR